MGDARTARGDKAPDETAELRVETAELQARINRLQTGNESLARKAACLEAERDAAREACRILREACTFMAGYLTAIEAWAKRACVAEGAAATRAQICTSMARADEALRGER